MENNSNVGMQFGFKKPDTENTEKEDNNNLPVEEDTVQTSVKEEVTSEEAEDLNEEYVDERHITIKLVKSYSLYRRANDKVLPKRNDCIGSSINSSLTLSSNKGEIETYFPNIVGLSPSNDDFITRVKKYWNNIHIPVDELGRKFDTSFVYNHKSDYYKTLKKEEVIEEEYKKADRSNIDKIKKALKVKIDKLNILESNKYKVGHPVNVEDYLMYRHCLLYAPIAKDIALINSDASIRFYFEDDKKEADKARKHRLDINKAKVNYVSCIADSQLFDAIYVQYCGMNNLPILSSLSEDRLEREIKLDKFSTEEPVKFNKLFNNKDIKLMATIEILIARGELIRSQYNQNISTPEGEFIAANMNEAVAWFKNPANEAIVNVYHNKLKNI